jgi:BirA family biotin operon repressor/biotin-[acetyl-CoA-carboxylase] ligase
MNQIGASAHAPLDRTRITHALAGCAIGHTVLYYESVASTMPIAQEIARRTESSSGTIVVAEEQSAGRGRLARQWRAPARQALLTSIVLQPPHLPAEPGHLPMLAGLAVVNALNALPLTNGIQTGLKWPNDILLGRGRSQPAKAGGILIESTFVAGAWQAAVVGVGINVNQLHDDLPDVTLPAAPPTSLRIELGRMVDRTALFIGLCQEWEKTFMLAPDELAAAWRSHLWTLGQPVSVYGSDGVILSGVAVDARDDGALVIEDETGQRRAVAAGDVSSRMEP